MGRLLFITHPDVIVDPGVPIERWRLSDRGIRRMRAFAESEAVAGVSAIWSSGEAKAIEAAGILAARFGLGIQVARDLGENDRSATGFLPPAEFERTADAFFARPDESIRGWETARDAQRRIVRAVEAILSKRGAGDLAIVAHGAVGTLLLTDYQDRPISRTADQPFQGHYWIARIAGRNVEQGWTPIAPRD